MTFLKTEEKDAGMVRNILILVCLLFVSCKSLKDKVRDKSETKETVTETTFTKRKGDTVTLLVPKIVYKDTLITKRGKTTTLNLKYDKSGNLDAECIAKEINELKQIITTLEKKNDIKTKSKENEVPTTLILYVFIGLAFLMVIYRIMNKFI